MVYNFIIDGNSNVISIAPINNKKSIPFANNSTNKSLADLVAASSNIQAAKNLEEQGNEYLKRNDFDNAIDCYKQVVGKNPGAVDAYYSLAKAYKYKEDYKNAIPAFQKYIEFKPDDVEANVLLGECYHQSGLYSKAKEQYEKAAKMDPSNDLPKRNLLELENNLIGCYDYNRAMQEKRKQASANLTKAVKMASDYLPRGYMKDMSNITVAFDKTSLMGGTANIAQYENSKKKVTVTDKYLYASPQLICAYLVHEFVHAKDKDGFTSVTEEQDAYRESVKFWKENSDGIKDPEMDYALDLYNKSPKTLDDRVAEIYQLRDPGIAITSPNHPPSSSKVAAANSLTQSVSAGLPIKHYDVIA